MSTAEKTNPPDWDRRRLLMVLAAVVGTAVVLLAGLFYAVFDAVAPTSPTDTLDSGVAPFGGTPGHDQMRRDRIAGQPMLQVTAADARPTAPAAVAGPTLQVPASTRTGPAGIPTGFPHTQAGAVGQLGALATTVLQAMSIPQANNVYTDWALPGGVGTAGWELTGNVRAFLETARMGPEKDLTATVTATPAAGQVKGVDGPDWVVGCVLLDVRATISQQARLGYGYCERMQWQGSRWMIAPGKPAARAPSTWPGSQVSVRAGWRTWVDMGQG